MTSDTPTQTAAAVTPWLVRIPDVFSAATPDVLRSLGVPSSTPLGHDYHLVKLTRPQTVHEGEAAPFLQWNLPVDHSWPCHPAKMEGFIEKAAQTLLKKFGARNPQGIFIGQLNPGAPDRYYRSLAANLRGRVLQLFPKLPAGTPEEQAPDQPSLFCLVGKEGLFAGMSTPRAANGFFAGGSKFMDQTGPDVISRAGAKIAEALHYLPLHRPVPPAGSHWLELGACPGGMTAELLARGQRVTAVDRAPLDRRLDNRPGLVFAHRDVADFTPDEDAGFDALLSDLNGPPQESMDHVTRLAVWLRQGALVVFTLKVPRVERLKEPLELLDSMVKKAAKAGLRLFARTHLTYNGHELTLFFEKTSVGGAKPAGR